MRNQRCSAQFPPELRMIRTRNCKDKRTQARLQRCQLRFIILVLLCNPIIQAKLDTFYKQSLSKAINYSKYERKPIGFPKSLKAMIIEHDVLRSKISPLWKTMSLDEFSTSTSLHGWHFIHDATSGKLRLAWGLLIGLSIGISSERLP